MFPQFFVITFPDLMQIQSIKMTAKYGKVQVQFFKYPNFSNRHLVKDILVERSTTERVANYEEISEKRWDKSENVLEEVLSNEEVTASHLKFTIKSGYDNFIGIFNVEVMGNLAGGRSPTMIRKTAR